jgi:hypothetical protein
VCIVLRVPVCAGRSSLVTVVAAFLATGAAPKEWTDHETEDPCLLDAVNFVAGNIARLLLEVTKHNVISLLISS